MQKSDILNDWKQRECVLATMHGKESVISPVFSESLGVTVTVPKNFNTDRFGTFTRDIARAGNQLEAARKKARAAMELTNTTLAVASEGSFGMHPSVPFVSSNLEIILLIDTENDIEIVGHHRTSRVQVRGQEVRTSEEAVTVACSWGFPKQGVIVRQSEKGNKNIYKELTTTEDVRTISKNLLSKWLVKSIYIETDMRAHRCPARIDSIAQATKDLIKNCKSLCPTCGTPGFVITDVTKGLPCKMCTLPTDLVKETIYSCQKCTYQESRPVEGKMDAEPEECNWCNP